MSRNLVGFFCELPPATIAKIKRLAKARGNVAQRVIVEDGIDRLRETHAVKPYFGKPYFGIPVKMARHTDGSISFPATKRGRGRKVAKRS